MISLAISYKATLLKHRGSEKDETRAIAIEVEESDGEEPEAASEEEEEEEEEKKKKKSLSLSIGYTTGIPSKRRSPKQKIYTKRYVTET